MKAYAGIGSRKTPVNVRELMTQLAAKLEQDGWILRSGGAVGADTAFERGVKQPRNKQIFLPWANFNGNNSQLDKPSADAFRMASEFHPAWERCSAPARKFHARNCHQVLGDTLTKPARMVVCWTPNAAITGGTGQALRIAQHHGIEICNMADPAVLARIEEYVK